MQACNAYSKTSLQDKPTLLLEFNGSEAGVKEQVETVKMVCTDNGGTDFQWAEVSRFNCNLSCWTNIHNISIS